MELKVPLKVDIDVGKVGPMSDSRRWRHLYVSDLPEALLQARAPCPASCDMRAYVIDADRVAHQVTEPGTPGFLKVVERFGDEVVTPEGTLDARPWADSV